MKILLVEDDEVFSETVIDIIKSTAPDAEVEVARYRDEAILLVERNFYDLAILDLKIPPIARSVEATPTHGFSVLHTIKGVAWGTPIFLLTGSSIEKDIRTISKYQESLNIWGGSKELCTVEVLKKIDISEFPNDFSGIFTEYNAINDIEILKDAAAQLSIQTERMLRIFTRRQGGIQCRVSRLSGGLSGSQVLRVKVLDDRGIMIFDSVAKLGTHQVIEDESSRYERYISRLAPEATPRKLTTLKYGAGNIAGVFYSTAGFDRTLFEGALSNDGSAAKAIQDISLAMAPWSADVPQQRNTIGNVRRRLISDEKFNPLKEKYDLVWADALEARAIQTKWHCIHGDLHAGNTLISTASKAIIIDYGDTSEGPASVDPVTLELCILFHPDAPALGGWPGQAARYWGDLERYIEGCPAAEYVIACRTWARSAAAGNRELAASAYAYLVRQLKYENTDKALILALLEGVRAFD